MPHGERSRGLECLMRRVLPAALTVAATVWLTLLVTAPSFPREMAVVYQFAGRVCHQRPERSFHLAGGQLPVCARCFGLYASGAIAAVAAWLSTRGPRVLITAGTARLAFAAAALPTVFTVALEWLRLAHPSNTARAIAALPLGAVAGWIFVRMLLIEAHTSIPTNSAGMEGRE